MTLGSITFVLLGIQLVSAVLGAITDSYFLHKLSNVCFYLIVATWLYAMFYLLFS